MILNSIFSSSFFLESILIYVEIKEIREKFMKVEFYVSEKWELIS